ncbi:hypothetical protein [Algoriphagus confluentis]|uniref:hypothetical protein n=1 Tax=Algoriphagus confluentis TaxID=1697556 RepID=UPI0030C7154D
MKKKLLKSQLKEIQEKDKREDFNLETRRYSGREFDRLIVILSGGGLTLSLSFIEKLTGEIDQISKCFLLLTWISFTVSLLLILISHLTSMKSIDLEILGKVEKSDKLDRITNTLNLISLGFLILAIIFFILFAYKSL